MTATADALEPLPLGQPGAVPDQQARLAGAVAPLARSREERMQRVLFLAGAIAVPLGIGLILLGYWGAAHASRVIQQIPYELSGGLLGLGLIVAGSFSYFAWWLTHLLREERRLADRVDEQTAVLVAALSRIELQLSAGETAGNGLARGSAPPQEGVLVATPTGTLVHRPDCQVVASRTDTRVVAPGTPGLKPCRICNPDL
jgi:hypothetical protein